MAGIMETQKSLNVKMDWIVIFIKGLEDRIKSLEEKHVGSD
jgi:hypothetical protein